jgi:hypothetical protein
MFATIAFALALTPSYETTAKDALKDLFLTTAKLRGIQARVDLFSKPSSKNAMILDGEATLNYESPTKFRIDLNESWGSSVRIVRNGDTLMTDPLYQGIPITLAPAPKTLTESYPGLATQQDWTMVLLFLLEGEDGYKKLVGDKAEEEFIQAPAGQQSIKFKSTALGTVTVTYKVDGDSKELQRAEFDNLPYHQGRHELYPQWVGPPQDPVSRQIVTLVHRRFDEKLFSVSVPKDFLVNDLRPKKPG